MKPEEIRAKREQIGLTQKEFADALGLGRDGQRMVRGWENGEHAPTAATMKSIVSFPTEPVFPEHKETRFRYIDLFAGIGGIRYPFHELGGKCVFTSEWDKFAQKTYRVNYGGEIHGDITQISEEDIPDHDILLAGFPCQPFSQAGLQKGFEDTRGTLFFEIARILKAKKPAAVLLENVKRFRSHDKGKTYATVRAALEELGYIVRDKVLRAADFGVPQNRERIFIVCFRKDLFKDCETDFNYELPSGPCVPTLVGDILTKGGVDPKYTISDRLYEGHLRRRQEHKKKGNGFGFCTVNALTPYTNTISARYYKDGSEILVEQEGKNPRKLTPDECRRLQGFPDEFVIPVSDTQAYRQFGNSVCVPVVRAVAESMLMVLEECGVVEEMSAGPNAGKAS